MNASQSFSARLSFVKVPMRDAGEGILHKDTKSDLVE